MTESTPVEKKEEPVNPCSETPANVSSKIIAIYEKIDTGEFSTEEAMSKIADVLKENRQAKLDCLKKLGL